MVEIKQHSAPKLHSYISNTIFYFKSLCKECRIWGIIDFWLLFVNLSFWLPGNLYRFLTRGHNPGVRGERIPKRYNFTISLQQICHM